VQDSGGTVGDTNNTILDAELAARDAEGVFMLPTIRINDKVG
jgi:hypothetical protein